MTKAALRLFKQQFYFSFQIATLQAMQKATETKLIEANNDTLIVSI